MRRLGYSLNHTARKAAAVAKEVFVRLSQPEPGSWEDRTLQIARGRSLSVVQEMDSAKWSDLPEKGHSLWNINCLIYVGKTLASHDYL